MNNRRQITRLMAGLLALALLLTIIPLAGWRAYAVPLGQAAPALLLTEIVVTPTGGEFIEIYNPGDTPVNLSNVYLTDATYAGGGTYYYNIVTGSNAGGGGYADFHARFPDGVTIAPDEYQTIALAGSDSFLTEYGINPAYELYEDGAGPDAIPDMREALSGSINNQGGLSNSGEVVIFYYWDGNTDLVTDLDYVVWGDKVEAVDKTGVSIDGPDSDTETSTYLPDTAIASQDVIAAGAHSSGNSWQRGDLSEGAETQTGGNGVDGDDETSEDLSNTWCENSPTPGAANVCPPPPPPPPVVTIMEIQGNGQFSPYDGQVVETSGVVTLFTANGAHFWLQDPAGDGDPATSDGIFVAGGGFPDEGPRPAVGDIIRIIAKVEEEQYGNALPLTRLLNVSLIEVLSSGNPLPAPIELSDLPDESITDGIAFWEPLEGMLASVDNAPVVAATSGYGEFAMLAKDDAKPGSGFYPQTQQILIRNLGGEVVDYNPERILVDDSSLGDPIVVMPGDRVRNLVGVVDYTYGNYKLQPASSDVKTHKLPNLPASTRSGPKGNTVITTFNVENLFDLVDEPGKDDIGTGGAETPEELEAQLTKLALAIQVELELPEILVVQEVENTDILQVLGDRVNAEAGTNYTAASFETSDGRGIEVGFLWDANRVALLDAFQMSGPDVEAAFGPSSPSPGREPLVGVFEIEGKEITIVGNHFKSKGGDDPLFGVNWPPIRITEVQRKMQAQVVRDLVNTILGVDPNALVMVTGDLNDFQFGEPGEDAGHPIAILEGVGGGVPLTNLLNLEKDDERYTYVYDGNSQVLDHMLVSPALYDLFVAVDVLHFNASFPDDVGEDDSTTIRASDHDPLEGRFNFR